MIEKLYKEFKQNMFAIHQLTERDKKHENAQTFFGELWEIFNPLILTIVLVLVFSTMFGDDSADIYPIYILTGVTLYNYYSQSTLLCLNALTNSKNLLIKSRLDRTIYVHQKVFLTTKKFVYSLFVYMFAIAWFRVAPSTLWILLIPDLLFFIMIIIGVGKTLAIVNVFFADITYFYRTFMVFLFYGSALFYNVNRLPMFAINLMVFNPIYDAIYIARMIVLNNQKGDERSWIALIIYSFVIYVAGSVIYKKYSDDIVAKI